MIRFFNWFVSTTFVTVLFLVGLIITIPAYSNNVNDSYLYGIIMFSVSALAFGIGIAATVLFRVDINSECVLFKFGTRVTKRISWNNASIEVHHYRGGNVMYLITEEETYTFFISKKIKKCLEERAPEYVLKKLEDINK